MRLTAETYRAIRARLAALGHVADWEWSQNVKPPATPAAFCGEYTWVVLNSGMKNTVAQKIMGRVWPMLVADQPIAPVFGHKGKALAIERTWRHREGLFTDFGRLDMTDAVGVLDWCEAMPWIGPITKYHLAKNLGVDCAKPDRWLVRLALAEGDPSVDQLCYRLARATGDRVATVDVVLWRACAVGVLAVENNIITEGPSWQ